MVTVAPSGFDAALGIDSSCTASATCWGAANTGGIGAAEQVTFSASELAAYELAVRCSRGACGSFTISVQ